MFSTIVFIALFILLVCAAYQNDRLNKIEEAQTSIASQLPYIKSVVDLDQYYISEMKGKVRDIHGKMFKPREKKSSGYIPKLPDPNDFYAARIPLNSVVPDKSLQIKVSFRPKMVEVGGIKTKYKMDSQEYFDEINRLISEGKLKARGCKLYRDASFKGTSKVYFLDSDGKKVDGRGKGPRDAHGRFTTRKEKNSKPVFNEA